MVFAILDDYDLPIKRGQRGSANRHLRQRDASLSEGNIFHLPDQSLIVEALDERFRKTGRRHNYFCEFISFDLGAARESNVECEFAGGQHNLFIFIYNTLHALADCDCIWDKQKNTAPQLVLSLLVYIKKCSSGKQKQIYLYLENVCNTQETSSLGLYSMSKSIWFLMMEY